MKMTNINYLRADFLFSLLWKFLLHLKAIIFGWPNHSSSLLPLLFISIVLTFCIFVIRKFLNIVQILRQKSVFLELTPPAFTEKTSYTTQQLFSVLHSMGIQSTFLDKLLGKRNLFSFEIVSTKEQGIRYVIRTTPDEAAIIERTIVSYLPQVRVKQIEEYLPQGIGINKSKIIEFKLRKHFAFPLAKQNVLNQHDPVAYITGMMTKLEPGELIALQIVVTPARTREAEILSQRILRNEDILEYLNKPQIPLYVQPFIFLFKALVNLINVISREIGWAVTEITHGSSPQQKYIYSFMHHQDQLVAQHLRPARVLSTFEQETIQEIQKKVDQELFDTKIRAFILINNTHDRNERIRGIKSSLAPFSVPKYQSLKALYNFPPVIVDKFRIYMFQKRLISLFSNKGSLLSVSEIADLYHFPYAQTTRTENIVKVHSKYLPAPLSLKNGRDLQVVFGQNTYGGTNTPIGLTKEERETHMYIIGRTGSGKTTMMFSMAKHDIENGEGMAFIDPHGDVSEDLLASVPEERLNDLIYINPVDLKYPVGINILELTPGLDEDEAELEKEVVCEGVISLFRKVFSKDENANAHRIEYILRNTIHTALTVQDATIFTVYDLLNNPPFQKQVIKNLTDENLKNFWKYEFGRAGNYQIVKMVGGVTAKIGRFLFSPTAKRILEQKLSTINFNEIMDQRKILLCNFSQGNLGEDTARLLGTTILTKIQQAALKRARLPKDVRRPFYLYVDEFQNFATTSFIKMLSEGRKYGLSVCIAEQSTTQQDDRNIVHNILANVTTVVCFRSANPFDEQLMLAQFSAYVEKGDISNLPRYNFYIKISAISPEEPFSGETMYTTIKKDLEKIEKLVQSSREKYATVYKRSYPEQKKLTFITWGTDKENKLPKNEERQQSGGFPEDNMNI